MPKLSWSFVIALTIHILIVLPSIVFMEKTAKINVSNAGARKLIGVNVTNGSSKESQGKKIFQTHGAVLKRLNSLQVSNAQNVILRGESAEIGNGAGEVHDGVSKEFGSANIYYTEPVYPKLARMRGLTGQVRIKSLVSESGELISTTIVKSSGHESLDLAALDAANKWKFQKNSTQYFVEKEIIFKLR